VKQLIGSSSVRRPGFDLIQIQIDVTA
jgi:hypothetical protein